MPQIEKKPINNAVKLSSIEIPADRLSEDTLTLLFIHGHESSKETWSPVFGKLKENHKIVAIDLRGHGESPSGNYDLSIKQLVDDIHQFVMEKKLSRIVIIAHSMGVRVAIPYTYQYPEEIKALIIEDMELLSRQLINLDETKLNFAKQFKQDHKSIENCVEELKKHNYSEEKIQSWIQQKRIKCISSNQTYHIGIHPYISYLSNNTCLASDEALKCFSKLAQPVLMLTAEKESSVSDTGLRQMKELLPSLVIKKIPQSKHAIHKTATSAFISQIESFLNGDRS